MNPSTKKGIVNSFNQLSNNVRRTKKQNEHIMKTSLKFIEIANSEGIREHRWIGSTASNLSVNYRDRGYDVDVMLISNNTSKEMLVDKKFTLIEKFREFGKKNYEKVKVYNKKPVISVRFMTKDGASKFHIDFVLATKQGGQDLNFIYSDDPLNKKEYEILENESVKMVEYFKNKIEENTNRRKAIVILKWWNDNKTKNLSKVAKLPSSLISEIVVEKNQSSIVDLIVESFEKITIDLNDKINNKNEICSDFEPKWDYLRKMNDSELLEVKEIVNSAQVGLKKALGEDSIEKAISILKSFFDGLEVVADEESSAGGTSGRAG